MTKKIIQQYSFHQFKQKLAYLCKKRGCKLILVHPALTTKTCSSCGYIQEVGKSEKYICPHCKLSIDRDCNSGKNVLIKGITICADKPHARI